MAGWISLDEIRAWLREQLPGAGAWVDRLPDWALYLIFALLALAFLASLWGGLKWLGKGIGLIPDENKQTRKALEEQQQELAAIRAQLNRMEAQRVAAGAAPLGAMERQRRDAAAAEIVKEQTPAADAAARELAEGDIAGAIATLERDARADVGAAAEKWRRLGALVMGVDTAKARAAYEEAFKLQPDDFWTCVELARLRDRSGDLDGARAAAECAVRAAQGERERTVADLTLGDVLVLAGDLAGAKARFEASLAVSERLAEQNKGSAEAQRDLIVSYVKMSDTFPKQGWAGKALAICEALANEGRLAPADAWMLEELRKRAAEDG